MNVERTRPHVEESARLNFVDISGLFQTAAEIRGLNSVLPVNVSATERVTLDHEYHGAAFPDEKIIYESDSSGHRETTQVEIEKWGSRYVVKSFVLVNGKNTNFHEYRVTETTLKTPNIRKRTVRTLNPREIQHLESTVDLMKSVFDKAKTKESISSEV